MEEQVKICRHCLKNCVNDFKVIEEDATEILNFLLKSVSVKNLPVSEEASVICANCTEVIKDCYNFKSTCLDIENSIVQFINSKGNGVKLDLKIAYDIPEDHDICRLCLCSLNICSFISVDSKVGDVVLRKMIENCIPELDLRVTKKPVICVPCRRSLQHYFDFIMNCLIVEETTKNIFNKLDKIKLKEKFCEDEEHGDNQKSNGKLTCSSDNSFTIKEDVEEVNKIKIEETYLEEIDGKVEFKSENLRKIEDDEFNNVPKLTIKCDEVDVQAGMNEIKQSYCQERVNKLEFKQQNLTSHQDIVLQTKTTINLPKTQKYLVEQPHRTRPQVLVKSAKKCSSNLLQHLSVQESASGRILYQKNICSYQIKYKRNKAKCRHLKTHLLTHDNPSEITMYRCEHCSFQTRHRISLKLHLLTHKSPSEITMIQCEFCSFQAKHKHFLQKHLLTHKYPSEITMYQCKHCSYQTKYSYHLKTHLLIHKNTSEITMYWCEHCTYQTKYKKSLKRHLVTHKSPSEITMIKCAFCSFKSKLKSGLKVYLLTHKNLSELTMHQCEHCSFQTKYKKT